MILVCPTYQESPADLLRRQQESLSLAVERAKAYDLALVINGVGILQEPSGIRGDEIVQIEHSCGRAPDEGVQLIGRAVRGSANNLTDVVDA